MAVFSEQIEQFVAELDAATEAHLRSDQALYAAKAAGRDRGIWAAPR